VHPYESFVTHYLSCEGVRLREGSVVRVTQASPTTVLGAEKFSPGLVESLREATAVAATASRAWFGRGDKNAADRAAVAAMRAVLRDSPFTGVVVIGEGEKDDAPMLANGELLGSGGVQCDVAVDPLDGTRLVAEGLPGSISVIAIAPRGTMFVPTDVFYMDKLICGAVGRGVVDIRRPVAENLAALARAKRVGVGELTVVILDKPRHAQLTADIRSAGAQLRLVGEGDVAVAVQAAAGDIDLVLGIGGTPEGIVAACAVKALGGFMQGRLAPQSTAEAARAAGAGHDLDRILELDDLVHSDDVLFVMTRLERL
jgi:fructose-1,6-bisphosphatase II